MKWHWPALQKKAFCFSQLLQIHICWWTCSCHPEAQMVALRRAGTEAEEGTKKSHQELIGNGRCIIYVLKSNRTHHLPQPPVKLTLWDQRKLHNSTNNWPEVGTGNEPHRHLNVPWKGTEHHYTDQHRELSVSYFVPQTKDTKQILQTPEEPFGWCECRRKYHCSAHYLIAPDGCALQDPQSLWSYTCTANA